MSPDTIRRYRWFRKAGVGGMVGRDAATCLSLARAEQYAIDNDWEFAWEDDNDGWEDLRADGFLCSCGCGRKIETCEGCILRDEDGNVLAFLWGIWDADDSYRRIVEAELAEEAMREEWEHDSANVLSL